MSQREKFIDLVLERRYPVIELCNAFGISEKTGYKWIGRFEREGRPGLADRSHAPHMAPHQLPRSVKKAVISLRELHPSWGPRKLRAALARKEPDMPWPAASTIGELLRREGMVLSRRRRASIGKRLDTQLTVASAPNHVWSTDFKGEFRLGSGPYCYPLTVLDAKSRYLLGCTALFSTASLPVQLVFTRLFQKYGVPEVIRSDNGVPFASPNALGQLSTLSVWWIRLGIRPERILPGCPQQNGQHERMHKTLKAEATRPPSDTLSEQQRRFDRFVREYNTDRPHEALGQELPATSYSPSPRSFPARLPRLEYPANVEVRLVSKGMAAWRGKTVWLTKSLDGQEVGFERTDTDIWNINFGPLLLGTYHDPSNTFLPEVLWKTHPPAGND
jgi:putative transposase